jgi:flagellar assembly protein FliH
MKIPEGNVIDSRSDLASSAIPFHFDDMRALGAKILRRANQQAQRMLEVARKQATEIEKSASEDGYNDGHKKGFDKGEPEGRAAGEKAAREEVRAATETLAQSLSAMIEELSDERLTLRTQAEVDLLMLALSIAGRVIKREIRIDDKTVLRNVEAAIALTVERRDVILYVNDADLEAVREYLPALESKFNDLTRVSVVGDAGVSRGGVRARTREGEVDLRIEEQLAALEQALLGDGGGEDAKSEPSESETGREAPE